MNEHPSLIDTATATVERVSDELIEVRFKPDVKLDVEGIGEVVNAKRTLCGADSPDVLAVMPPEVDFELNVLNVDHSKAHGGCPTRRLAFAGQSPLNERLAHLYFSYFPRHSETRVFHDEREAGRGSISAPRWSFLSSVLPGKGHLAHRAARGQKTQRCR